MHYNLYETKLIGNIGSVEVINEGQPNELKKISVACNFGYIEKATAVEVKGTDWVEVILGRKENMANYSRGRKVLIEGVPTVNAYVNKDGEAVGKLVIVAPRVTFQDAKPGEKEQQDDHTEG